MSNLSMEGSALRSSEAPETVHPSCLHPSLLEFARVIGAWSHRICNSPILTNQKPIHSPSSTPNIRTGYTIEEIVRGVDDAAVALMDWKGMEKVEDAQKIARERLFEAVLQNNLQSWSNVPILMDIFPVPTWTAKMFNSALQQKGDLDATKSVAAAWHESGLPLDTLDTSAIATLAHCLQLEGKTEEATRMFDVCRGGGARLYQKAHELVISGEEEEAIALLAGAELAGKLPRVRAELQTCIEQLSKGLRDKGFLSESAQVICALPERHWDEVLFHRFVMNLIAIGHHPAAMAWMERWKRREKKMDDHLLDAFCICCNKIGRPQDTKLALEVHERACQESGEPFGSRLRMRLIEADCLLGCIPEEQLTFDALMDRIPREHRSSRTTTDVLATLHHCNRFQEIASVFPSIPAEQQTPKALGFYIGALVTLGRGEEALLFAEQRKELWNDHVRISLADVLSSKGKHREAQVVIGDVATLCRDKNATAHYAVAAAREGTLREALEGRLNYLITCPQKMAVFVAVALRDAGLHEDALFYLSAYRGVKRGYLINLQADMLMKQHRPQEVIGLLDSTPREQWDPACYSHYAWALLSLRQASTACDELEYVQDHRPHLWDAGLIYVYSQCLLRIGDEEKLETLMEAPSTQACIDEREIRYMKVNNLRKDHRPTTCETVLQLIPESERMTCPVRTFNVLAFSLLRSRQYTALEQLLSGRSLDTWSMNTFTCAMECNVRTKQYEKALITFAGCRERMREIPARMCCLAATAYALCGRTEETHALLAEAESDKESPTPFHIACHYLRCNRPDRALPHIKRIINGNRAPSLGVLRMLAICASLGSAEAGECMETYLHTPDTANTLTAEQIANLRTRAGGGDALSDVYEEIEAALEDTNGELDAEPAPDFLFADQIAENSTTPAKSATDDVKKDTEAYAHFASNSITQLRAYAQSLASLAPDTAVTPESPAAPEKTISSQEIRRDLEKMFDEIKEAGLRHFAGEPDAFLNRLDSCRTQYDGLAGYMTPRMLRTTLDFAPMRALHHMFTDPELYTPAPSRVDLWIWELLIPKFAELARRVEETLPPPLALPPRTGTVPRKQIVDALLALEGKMTAEMVAQRSASEKSRVKAYVASEISSAISCVVCGCPEPLQCTIDLECLRGCLKISKEEGWRATGFKKTFLRIWVKALRELVQQVESLLSQDLESLMKDHAWLKTVFLCRLQLCTHERSLDRASPQYTWLLKILRRFSEEMTNMPDAGKEPDIERCLANITAGMAETARSHAPPTSSEYYHDCDKALAYLLTIL